MSRNVSYSRNGIFENVLDPQFLRIPHVGTLDGGAMEFGV